MWKEKKNETYRQEGLFIFPGSCHSTTDPLYPALQLHYIVSLVFPLPVNCNGRYRDMLCRIPMVRFKKIWARAKMTLIFPFAHIFYVSMSFFVPVHQIPNSPIKFFPPTILHSNSTSSSTPFHHATTSWNSQKIHILSTFAVYNFFPKIPHFACQSPNYSIEYGL